MNSLIAVGKPELTLVDDTERRQSVENLFLVPYVQNDRFSGRAKFLQTIKETLSRQAPNRYNNRVALYGMGGVGKTQVAVEYVYRNRVNYERIYWLTAINEASLLSGYQAIARIAGIPRTSDLNPSETAKLVLLWLQQKSSWLIVFDNLDDFTVAEHLLPKNASGKHTLITTRNPNIEGIPAEGLEVPLLDHEEAVGMLLSLSDVVLSSPHEKQAADEIVVKLGYLPLAIEQAAAYVREVTGSLTGFLDDYQQYRQVLHRWIPGGNRLYPYSVATTWSISFRIIVAKNAQAGKLLQLLSFLNPNGVLIEFLQDGANALGEDLDQVVSDPYKLAKALLVMENHSLIKWDRQNKSLSIHRLVQAVIKDEMSETELTSILSTLIDLCDLSFPIEINNNTLKKCRLYEGQVVEPLLRVEIRSKKCASIKERVGNFLLEDGKYEQSETFLLQALDLRIEFAGLESLSTATVMSRLARTYALQGNLSEAALLEEKVLMTRKLELGEMDTDTFLALSNLALTYDRMGRFTDAAALLEEALPKMAKVSGKERPDLFLVKGNLALVYRHQERIDEAFKLEKQVLEETCRLFPPDHPHVLNAMVNLAITSRELGRKKEAVELMEEVLQRRIAAYGDEHPSTLIAKQNLGSMYMEIGATAEADGADVGSYEKALGRSASQYPRCHGQSRYDI